MWMIYFLVTLWIEGKFLQTGLEVNYFLNFTFLFLNFNKAFLYFAFKHFFFHFFFFFFFFFFCLILLLIKKPFGKITLVERYIEKLVFYVTRLLRDDMHLNTLV
jgi:hypothetical protein